jgi:hypothetical protein
MQRVAGQVMLDAEGGLFQFTTLGMSRPLCATLPKRRFDRQYGSPSFQGLA